MKNLLIYSDTHIMSTEIEECDKVFNEIIMLCEKYNISQVLSLGDNFNNNKPSALELNCMANFIKKLNRPIILLAAQSHESETSMLSSVDIFGILDPNVKIVKEHIDEEYMFCGHFFLNESKTNYGATRTASEFSKYRYVLLGHSHSLQAIGKNIMHIGSSRFIDFAESQDKAKCILLIENYKEQTETNHIIALKSPYPMRDIIISKNGATASPGAKSEGKKWQDALDSLPAKTKVRLIFKDFESYSNSINFLDKYKQKFVLFKIKQDFIISDIDNNGAKTETVNLKESLIKYLEDNKTPEDIKAILLGEIR